METTQRAMTTREREELEGLISAWAHLARGALFLGTLVALAWFLRAVQSGLTELAFPIWVVPTVLFGAWLYVRAGRWTGGRHFREQIRLDLERGEMVVRRVRVADAIAAPEVEDEGPVIFVRDEKGAVLFFAGQEFARKRQRGFPWEEFYVSQAPNSGHLLNVRSAGAPFEPVLMRAPLSLDEARRLGVLAAEHGVLDEDWADLKGDIQP